MGNRYELGGRGIFELSRPGPQQDDSPSLLGATEVAQPACQHGRSDLPRKAPSLCDALELLLALLPQSLQHGIRHREHLLPPSYRGLNPWVYVSDVGIDGAGSKKQSERREDHRGGGRKRQGLSFGATRNSVSGTCPSWRNPRRPQRHSPGEKRPRQLGVLRLARTTLAPSAGFEPAHPAPEADALSPELRGLDGTHVAC